MAFEPYKVSCVLCSEQESDHKGTIVTAKIFNDHDKWKIVAAGALFLLWRNFYDIGFKPRWQARES